MELLVLWDGDCGFCEKSLEWVRKQKVMGSFRYLSFHNDAAAAWRKKIGVEALKKAMYVINEEGKIFSGADGFRVILSRMPRWKWLAFIMGLPGIRQISHIGYKIIAANRSRLGKHACKLKR